MENGYPHLDSHLSHCTLYKYLAAGKEGIDKRTGVLEVADVLIFVFHKYDIGFTVRAGEINHQPALLFYDGDQLKICQVFGIEPETNKIFQISNVLDPEKLKSIGNSLA